MNRARGCALFFQYYILRRNIVESRSIRASMPGVRRMPLYPAVFAAAAAVPREPIDVSLRCAANARRGSAPQLVLGIRQESGARLRLVDVRGKCLA